MSRLFTDSRTDGSDTMDLPGSWMSPFIGCFQRQECRIFSSTLGLWVRELLGTLFSLFRDYVSAANSRRYKRKYSTVFTSCTVLVFCTGGTREHECYWPDAAGAQQQAAINKEQSVISNLRKRSNIVVVRTRRKR